MASEAKFGPHALAANTYRSCRILPILGVKQLYYKHTEHTCD